MMTARRILRTTDVQQLTGWSLVKIRKLIADGRLKAVNTSCGRRPYWEIPVEAFEAFLKGNSERETPPVPEKVRRPARVDANVPKVFG